MLLIAEMVTLLPKKDVYQKTPQKNHRNQPCDDDAYNGQTLFAQEVVFSVSFTNVDILNHVDEGQDYCECLENCADFS